MGVFIFNPDLQHGRESRSKNPQKPFSLRVLQWPGISFTSKPINVWWYIFTSTRIVRIYCAHSKSVVSQYYTVIHMWLKWNGCDIQVNEWHNNIILLSTYLKVIGCSRSNYLNNFEDYLHLILFIKLCQHNQWLIKGAQNHRWQQIIILQVSESHKQNKNNMSPALINTLLISWLICKETGALLATLALFHNHQNRFVVFILLPWPEIIVVISNCSTRYI